jgi:outer membrane lipoprotein-sorting protein
MSSHRKPLFTIVIALLLAALFSGGCRSKGPKSSKDVQFSARMVVEESGATTSYAVNFTRQKQRVEMQMDEHGAGAIIMRPDKGVVWVLMPAMNTFVQTEIKPENKNPLVYEPDYVLDWLRVGNETIDGHPVVKDKLTIHNKGDKEMAYYRWFATDLGWPIRAQALDGSWLIYYKDIKTGPQDPSLFEPPSGYRMMTRKTGH